MWRRCGDITYLEGPDSPRHEYVDVFEVGLIGIFVSISGCLCWVKEGHCKHIKLVESLGQGSDVRCLLFYFVFHGKCHGMLDHGNLREENSVCVGLLFEVSHHLSS